MTKEEQFKSWWFQNTGLNTEFPSAMEIAEITWTAAWCAATLGQWEATKAEVLSEIKAKLFAEATAAFLDGDDDEAMLLRRIANKIST